MPQNQSLDIGFLFLDYQDHNLYQLRQWLQPLERLQAKQSVKVFYTSHYVADELKQSSIEGIYFEGQNGLIEALYNHSPKVLLYPNQNIRNFYALRYPNAVHVFVSHGESDKAYMTQNTIKRYDLYFAAGRAAIDRITSKVSNFDSAKRIMEIGRPQSLDKNPLPADFIESQDKKILYAPTWEGVTRATRYTSIVSHGLKLVQALIGSGRYQITYRPHPLSGSRDSEVKKSDEAIKKIILNTARTEVDSHHYVDESPFGWHLGYHDLMISDISAIAYDWLSTGKPILLTKPVDEKAVIGEFPLVDKLESIKEADLPNIEKLIAHQFVGNSIQRNLSAELNAYYFRQPTKQNDEHFAGAIQHAISFQQTHLASQNFAKLEAFESRGAKLGFLRYPNYAIREVLRITGGWSTSKQLAKLGKIDEFFIHLSDPFNGKSARPSFETVLEAHQKGKKLVLVLNQVTSLLAINWMARKPQFKGLAEDIVVVPVANASDCEEVVAKLKPSRAWYLKHHPLNHMLLRLNGLEHGLWKPDIDPLFSADHSLITYDVVFQPSKSTAEFIDKLPDISKPKIVHN